MSNLPGLVVDVEARIDKLEKALKKANAAQARSAGQMESRAEQSARRLRDTFGKAGDSSAGVFDKIAKSAAAARTPILAVAAAATAAAAALDRAAANIAQIGDEARRAGVSATAFQELGFVAQQNRVPIDALVDGLKELNLRGDEWVQTGGGSAADAFKRLGFEAGDLARRLEDPSGLMLEIIGRLESFDKAAQIRIADEIFGGQGGEKFVQLIEQGEDGLRETIDRAHELGIVLDDDVIERAEEINRKFGELRQVSKVWVQGFIVDLADAVVEMTDFRERLDRLFPDEAEGRAVLGDKIYNTLEGDRDLVDANADVLATIRSEFGGLTEDVDRATAAFDRSIVSLSALGYDEQANDLREMSTELKRIVNGMNDNTISADEFQNSLGTIAITARTVFDTLDEADRVDFGIAISEVGRLGSAIGSVLFRIHQLKQGLKDVANNAAAVEASNARRAAIDLKRSADAESMRTLDEFESKQRDFLAGEEARDAKSRETLEVEREIADVRERAGKAGTFLTEQQARDAAITKIAADALRDVRTDPVGAGAPPADTGGGSARADEFQRGVEKIKELTKELDVERLALLAAAAAGGDYARSVDIARQKAELLNAALKAGRADSPGLRAEIDQLVGSWDAAAQATEGVRDNLEELRSAQEAFESSLEDAFVGLVTGAQTFQQALSNILRQLASMAASRLFRQLLSGPVGNASGSFLSRIFGFADGGYTGSGGTHEPAGIVHKGEFVMSKRATDRIGVNTLAGLHSAALRGYASGGYVGPAQHKLGAVAPAGGTAISISAPITVHGNGGTTEQNADLARQMSKAVEGTMRGVVLEELQRQLRPGNMLNRRTM